MAPFFGATDTYAQKKQLDLMRLIVASIGPQFAMMQGDKRLRETLDGLKSVRDTLNVAAHAPLGDDELLPPVKK